jgi:hypothetical protein
MQYQSFPGTENSATSKLALQASIDGGNYVLSPTGSLVVRGSPDPERSATARHPEKPCLRNGLVDRPQNQLSPAA